MARLKRLNYFSGQLLSVDDFLAEQEYHRAQRRRHNLLFHGSGIVVGLEVSITKDGGVSSVVVAPGHAVDNLGQDIELCPAVKLPLPKAAKLILVQLRYVELLTDYVPATSEGVGEQSQPSRVEEGGEVTLAPQPSAASPKTLPIFPNPIVVLARLLPIPGGWRIDRRYKAPRAR